MAQYNDILKTIRANTTGEQFLMIYEQAFDAVVTNQIGTAAPSYVAGLTDNPGKAGIRYIQQSGNIFICWIHDGSEWIVEHTVDTTDNLTMAASNQAGNSGVRARSNSGHIVDVLSNDSVKLSVGTTGVSLSSAAAGVGVDLSAATDALRLPSGTTDQRPDNPVRGDRRRNTTLNAIEEWDGTNWVTDLPNSPASNWGDSQTRQTIVDTISAGTNISITGGTGGLTINNAIATTDNLTEGTANLWFTDERVDDRVGALINSGRGIVTSYNDGSNQLSIAVDPSKFTSDTGVTVEADGANVKINTTGVSKATNDAIDLRMRTIVSAGDGLKTDPASGSLTKLSIDYDESDKVAGSFKNRVADWVGGHVFDSANITGIEFDYDSVSNQISLDLEDVPPSKLKVKSGSQTPSNGLVPVYRDGDFAWETGPRARITDASILPQSLSGLSQSTRGVIVANQGFFSTATVVEEVTSYGSIDVTTSGGTRIIDIASGAVGASQLNISAGANITFSTSSNQLTISASGSGGGGNAITISGGSGITTAVSGTTTTISANIVAGSNVSTAVSAQGTLTISASGGGGTPADGSITTAKLADDAVTAAKVADDAVGAAALNVSAGANITFSTANDVLTISAASGGGGGSAITVAGTNGITVSVSGTTYTASLVTAGTAAKGGVIVGSGLAVNATGTLSAAIASQAEAENGVENTKPMSALRVSQFHDETWKSFNLTGYQRITSGNPTAGQYRISGGTLYFLPKTGDDTTNASDILKDGLDVQVSDSGGAGVGLVGTISTFSVDGGSGFYTIVLRSPYNGTPSLLTGNADILLEGVAAHLSRTQPLEDGSVTAAKIAGGAVTAGKIAAGAVGSAALADDAVTAAKIADGAVGTAAIAAGGVDTSELAADSVTQAKIASGAVGTTELAADAVTAAKVADNAIGAAALNVSGNGTLGNLLASDGAGGMDWVNTGIGDGTITTAKLADGAATLAKMSIGTTSNSGNIRVVGTSGTTGSTPAALTLSAGSNVTLSHSAGVVTVAASGGGTPADGSITTAKLADDAVTAAKIADGAVGTAAIAAGGVDTSELAADSVTQAKIAAGAVGTNELAPDSVTSGKIADGAVDTSELAAGAATLAKLDIGTTSNSGEIRVVGTTGTTAATPGVMTLSAGSNVTLSHSAGVVTVAASGGGGGGASVTVSQTAPSNPSNGDLWMDSDDGKLRIYYSADSTWIGVNTAAQAGQLTDLSDVSGTPTDGQALVWDNANSTWEPGDAAGGGMTRTVVNHIANVSTGVVSIPSTANRIVAAVSATGTSTSGVSSNRPAWLRIDTGGTNVLKQTSVTSVGVAVVLRTMVNLMRISSTEWLFESEGTIGRLTANVSDITVRPNFLGNAGWTGSLVVFHDG